MKEIQQKAVETTSYPVLDRDFLKLKLDMQNLHKDIKQFLSGKESVIVRDEKTGSFMEVVRDLGKPYANNEGIQNLYGTIKFIVNEHTVQGNKETSNDLNKFLNNAHEDLTKAIHRNWRKWDIPKDNREFIIDRMMAMTELVLSRTIGDSERKYMNPGAMKATSFTVPQQKKSVI